MSFPSAPSAKGAQRRRFARHLLVSQHGGLSPFMYGLLLGMSIFSVVSMRWAEKELVAQQQKNAEKARAQAEDIAKGLEFSMLTETGATYSNDISLDRALSQTSSASGKTRGGEEVLLVERDAGSGDFGHRNQRVAITATDDTLFRSQVYRTGSAEELSTMRTSEKLPVVTFDSDAVRDRQVRTSYQNMVALAEHIYGFYAGQMPSPTGTEFDEIASHVNLRDAWGQSFSYTQTSDDKATLQFTTPWNFTRTLNISLKDEKNSDDESQ